MKTTAVILAAGKGTRMKSNLHKVLHPILGKSMIQHVINSVSPAISEKPIVVVGQDAESVMAAVEGQAQFALQTEQLGTGHAVLSAKPTVTADTDIVLVSFADMPLFRTETYAKLIQLQQQNTGPITMATVIAQDPRGFGRIVRNEQNEVIAIVEEAVATPEQLLINELNISAYCFDANWLWDALTKIKKSPKGEYYLTDVVEIAVSQGEKIQAIVLEDNDEAIGVNNRVHLSEAQAALQKRINQEWMLAGVTIIDPRTTYIETDVHIGMDTVIHPNTILKSGTYHWRKLSDRSRHLYYRFSDRQPHKNIQIRPRICQSRQPRRHGPLCPPPQKRPPRRSRPHGQLRRSQRFLPRPRCENGTLLLYWQCHHQ